MLSILCVRLTIKVKVGIPESFKVGWYSSKKTGSSQLYAKAKTMLPEEDGVPLEADSEKQKSEDKR